MPSGTYDVIVVGGGSAGAPLAARLSEDPHRRVLLLDAGRDWRAADAPHALRSANILPFMHDPAHQQAWQWPGLMARRTAAQQPHFYWRGRAMGGSSVVNAQIAIRGVPAAFDAWAEQGCEGWGSERVLPLFDAIEDDAEFGGRGAGRPAGPLPVHRAPLAQWGAVDLALREAALAAGYAWHANLNAPTGDGVACNPINSRDGQRVTTNDGYLEPARHRPNLEIVGGALVDRVLFEGSRAAGVRVELGGRWQDIAARQVALCAGAIHSPCVLMRSGIGPAAELAALGIAVRCDHAGVGANLFDHPIVRATLHLRPEAQARGLNARHTNCCLTYSSGRVERDMIMIAYNHRGLTDGPPAPVGAVGVALYDSVSRGHLRLTAADPHAQPDVEENMLADEADRARLRDGVRRLAGLLAHSAFGRIAERQQVGDAPMTPSEAAALPDDALDRLMLAQASDIQHAAGTCRMSAHEDPRGVVDPQLRVRGVEGLRIADASIMPTDCRANLHFTCVMIGEMCARMMQERRRDGP